MDTANGYMFAPNVEFRDLDLSDFQSVVKAFGQRMDGWFFKPINRLFGYENNLFVITAIECMVVDTLSGFWYGDSGTKKNFTDFLVERMNIHPDIANAFYLRFRCGIVHQTNIKENSVISEKVKDFQLDNSNVLYFNPIGFFVQLITYFDKYLKELGSRSDGVQSFKRRFKQLFNDEFDDNQWQEWHKS
jgi:hypothetical protein